MLCSAACIPVGCFGFPDRLAWQGLFGDRSVSFGEKNIFNIIFIESSFFLIVHPTTCPLENTLQLCHCQWSTSWWSPSLRVCLFPFSTSKACNQLHVDRSCASLSAVISISNSLATRTVHLCGCSLLTEFCTVWTFQQGNFSNVVFSFLLSYCLGEMHWPYLANQVIIRQSLFGPLFPAPLHSKLAVLPINRAAWSLKVLLNIAVVSKLPTRDL